MIISRTPVRISFFGGGTDYPEFFDRRKGAVLGTTINKYVHVSVNHLSKFFEYNVRVGYSKSELVNSVEDIQHPSVRETLKFLNYKGNLDIHIFADLPARTGLGSSSAFTVGFLNAMYGLEGKVVPMQCLAEEAIFIEQQLIKENVGCQDQVHASYGGLNIIEFDQNGFSARPVVIATDKLSALNSGLLVFYTGQTRYASQVVKEQIEKTSSCRNDIYLSRMFDMVFEAERMIADSSVETVLLDFGNLLKEGWDLKKKLSSQITNDLIDEAYQAAMSAGAYGGKLAGAGNGGFLIFMAPEKRHAAIRKKLSGMPEVKVAFESEGSKIIYLSR